MKPAKLDLPTIWRNCDWLPVTFKWKDSLGNPIDLTPYAAAALTRDFTIPLDSSQAAEGIMVLSMTNIQTAALKLGVYQWNWVFRTQADPTLIIPPILYGIVEVKNPILPTLPL